MIALCLRDAGLMEKAQALAPEVFSSPLLGKVFGQLVSQYRMGKEPSLTALTDLTGEEMAHVAGILQRNTDVVSEQALLDSMAVIRDAHEFQNISSNEDLMSLQRKLRERKGIRP